MGKANFFYSSRDNCWKLTDKGGAELLRVGGTAGVEIPSGSTLTINGTFTSTDKLDSDDYAADSIDKEHLASEIYAIEPVCYSGQLDNDTIVGLYKCWSACTVIRVCYWTSQALGSGLGIDVVDGETDGTGSSVIDSCSDNLNGSDVNDLTTPHALSAGDYINLVVDNVTNSTHISVIILLKVPLGAAT